VHWHRYAEINDYLGEYTSGAHLIEANTTLLALPFVDERTASGRMISPRIPIFMHTSGYIAAERQVVDLRNYEATTDYFPLRFRPSVDPTVRLGVDGRLWGLPPCVDVAGYRQRTGAEVDYVLIWDASEEQKQTECGSLLFGELERGYELLLTSSRGLMRLYRRAGWGGGTTVGAPPGEGRAW
jgi:hypothetical protein